MEDALLDMSQDELTVKETQLRDSPATFSRNLVDRFKIIGHNNQTGSETVNPIDNNTNTELYLQKEAWTYKHVIETGDTRPVKVPAYPIPFISRNVHV